MRTLLEDEAKTLLSAGKVGRLGCVVNGEPYVVPINYVFTGDTIYSHSLPGRKLQALRANPRTCLQVDDIQDDFNWRSVIAYGDFEELPLPGDREAVLAKLLNRFPSLTPVESAIVEDAAAPASIVFRIRVDRITGVSED
jgi:nitroimidazol reductase NimA-like FMN-containing flavoprotein (pyridoxamine 5'-phosphate oxidase superfamily)